MIRLILTTTAVMAVLAGPASAATYEEKFRSSSHTGAQDGDASTAAVDGDYRTSYQPVPPSNTGQGQDLRSPDAVDAAAHRGIYAAETKRAPYALNRDYGSPDAADAARDLPPVQVPVVAAQPNPSGGFDWGDAGIGAAGMVGLFGIAGACALMLSGRRSRHGLA
jgi:hypothetical protein